MGQWKQIICISRLKKEAGFEIKLLHSYSVVRNENCIYYGICSNGFFCAMKAVKQSIATPHTTNKLVSLLQPHDVSSVTPTHLMQSPELTLEIPHFSKEKIKHAVEGNLLILKIKIPDLDNLVKAISIILKTYSEEEKGAKKTFEDGIRGIISKKPDLRNLNNCSLVSKAFHNSFKKSSIGGAGFLNLPVDTIEIIKSFLAHEDNLCTFQNKTLPLKNPPKKH